MKEKILELLYQHENNYLSGQEISRLLGISRTAVWKHVKILQQQGYCIETGHRRGYRLVRRQDLMLPGELRQELKTRWLGHSMVYMDTVSSTNLWAKENLMDLAHGTVVLAEEQTQGRGRLGKYWDSSKGDGIWMTLVLRPHLPMGEGAKITQLAAAAMHQALIRLTNLPVKIKWPNDLLVDDRKICGILTEMTGELTRIESLLVGIGVNVNQQSFTGEIQKTAVSLAQLTGKKVSRIKLLEVFLQEFEKMFDDFVENDQYESVLEIVRNNSSLLNQRINIFRGDDCLPATAIQVHEDGRLEVQYDDGRQELLSGGEVSIRR
ncbi:MAG: biotin--[acetyl-CoA-carboxylase] ligase [Bacillota bacterium]|nr:biotin--[acetyl-CoA-carboxylase] ligase [Bacillota bacterium]